MNFQEIMIALAPQYQVANKLVRKSDGMEIVHIVPAGNYGFLDTGRAFIKTADGASGEILTTGLEKVRR